MAADNALTLLLQYLQCVHCNRFLRESYWVQSPCLHAVCAECLTVSRRCPVCWQPATTLVNSPTMARVAALLAMQFAETRKPEYCVTLAPCTLPGLKSLLQEAKQVQIVGDLSVDDVGMRVARELEVEGVKLEFGMCGEMLTGGELLSELEGCFENGQITLECGFSK